MQPGGSERRCLLTDAMGTLVHLRPPAAELRRQLAERFAVEVTLEQAAAAIRAEIAYYRTHMLDGRDPDGVRALRRRCARELRAALPSGLGEIDDEAMTEALLASLQFERFGDVAGTLGAMRARGWGVVVVSNWDQSLGSVLVRVGLGALLDGVVTSAEVGAGKPDPRIFKAALELAGVSADEALHVGDSLEEDVAGAHAAGIEVVWLNRDRADPRPPAAGVVEIAGLDELPAAITPGGP
jgi:putative hydrolase of the HAD superfamily